MRILCNAIYLAYLLVAAQRDFGGSACLRMRVMLISRLRSFSPAPGRPGAYVFRLNDEVVRPIALPVKIFFLYNANSTCHTCPFTHASTSRCRLQLSVPLLRAVCFGRLHGYRNFCSRCPRGLNFFMHSHPPHGGQTTKISKKNSTIFFSFCLISPTHFPTYNSCSTCTRGLKFVMRIDPPHAEPTTTCLCFKRSTKIASFLQLFEDYTVLWRFWNSNRFLTSVLMWLMCVW